MEHLNTTTDIPPELNPEPKKLCIICAKRPIETAVEINPAECNASESNSSPNSSLSSTLVVCLSGESYVEPPTESPQEFCKNCTNYLQEWQTLVGQISQLLERTNRIKFTLIAYLLENHSTGNLSGSSSTLAWKLKEIRTRLAGEFNANIILGKCDQTYEDSDLEIETDFQDSGLAYDPHDDEIVDLTNVLTDADSSDHTDFEDSRIPRSKKRRKRPVVYKVEKTSENEFTYADKYKFSYAQPEGYTCTECSKSFGWKISIMRHIRDIHINKLGQVPEAKSKLLRDEQYQIGRKGSRYFGKSTCRNGLYHCNLCPHILSSRRGMYYHLKKHVEGVSNTRRRKRKSSETTNGQTDTAVDATQSSGCESSDDASPTEFLQVKCEALLTPEVSIETPNDPLENAAEPSASSVADNNDEQLETRSNKSTDVEILDDDPPRKEPAVKTYRKSPTVVYDAVETSPNEFLYANKYKFTYDPIEGYTCGECSRIMSWKISTLRHIRVKHMNLKPKLAAEPKKTLLKRSTTFKGGRRGSIYSDKFVIKGSQYCCILCPTVLTTRRGMLYHVQKHMDRRRKYCYKVKSRTLEKPLAATSDDGQVPEEIVLDAEEGENDVEAKEGENDGELVNDSGTRNERRSRKSTYGEYYSRENGKYLCKICPSFTKTPQGIVYHIKKHLNNPTAPIKIVKTRYAGDTPLVEPIKKEFVYDGKTIEVSQRGYVCPECRVRRKSKRSIILHIQRHHPAESLLPKELTPVEGHPNEFLYNNKHRVTQLPNSKLRCRCGVVRRQEKSMIKHLQQQHLIKKPGSRMWNFSVTETARNEYLYNEKFPIYYLEAEEMYKCGLCEHRHNACRALLPHIRENHYSDEDRQKFTAVQTGEWEYLYGGKYRITFNAEGRYFCGICNFSKLQLTDLYGHIRLYHSDDNPKTVVFPEFLPKGTPSEAPLEMKHHGIPYTYDSGTMKYTCSACQKSVRNRSYLLHHIKTRHHDAPQQFICEMCGDSFGTKQCLTLHRGRHGEAKHKCTQCDKSFRMRKSWKIHMAIHATGEAAKKYQCEHCGKKFGQKCYLDNHVRLHTGEKPFPCSICQEKFTDRGRLSYHRKTVHGLTPQRYALD